MKLFGAVALGAIVMRERLVAISPGASHLKPVTWNQKRQRAHRALVRYRWIPVQMRLKPERLQSPYCLALSPRPAGNGKVVKTKKAPRSLSPIPWTGSGSGSRPATSRPSQIRPQQAPMITRRCACLQRCQCPHRHWHQCGWYHKIACRTRNATHFVQVWLPKPNH